MTVLCSHTIQEAAIPRLICCNNGLFLWLLYLRVTPGRVDFTVANLFRSIGDIIRSVRMPKEGFGVSGTSELLSIYRVVDSLGLCARG